LPLVGPIPADDWTPNHPQYWPNLYLCVAMGSRGFASAPLAADYLASLIHQEALPLTPSLRNALNPERFWKRKPSQIQG